MSVLISCATAAWALTPSLAKAWQASVRTFTSGESNWFASLVTSSCACTTAESNSKHPIAVRNFKVRIVESSDD